MTAVKRGRGRPAYEPDEATCAKVKLWIAGGLSVPDIAHLLGVTAPTVRKLFKPEIATRGAEVKAQVLEATFEQAMKGNVAAQGKLLARFDVAEALANPKAQKQGKKEQRQAQAERKTSGGKFAVPQPPKLVVANG